MAQINTKRQLDAARKLAALSEADEAKIADTGRAKYHLSNAELEELSLLRLRARTNLYKDPLVRAQQSIKPATQRDAVVQNKERFVFNMFGNAGGNGYAPSVGRLGMLKSALNNFSDILRTEKQKFTKDNIALLHETVCRDVKDLCDLLKRLSETG